MKLLYFTDTHWCDEEPFFVAAKAMSDRLLLKIGDLTRGEPFTVVHGGDVFKRSKETGRVNGLVVSFFTRLLALKGCERVYVLQGNHDVKKETGSALDCLLDVDSERLKVFKTPEVIPLWNGKNAYMLPYMPPYSYPNYKTVATYGEPSFHEPIIGGNEIAVVFAHVGDETSGEFFAQADMSFLPGTKCHGHVHKRVSEHYPGSAMITKRDETDQIGHLRVFDSDLKTVSDVPIDAPFNFLKVNFNEDVLEAFCGMKVLPYGSVVVDVKGHDSDEAVNRWFEEQKAKLPVPAFLGSVYPDEKTGGGESVVESGEEGQKMNLRDLFEEFCVEKNVDVSVKKRIEAVL